MKHVRKGAGLKAIPNLQSCSGFTQTHPCIDIGRIILFSIIAYTTYLATFHSDLIQPIIQSIIPIDFRVQILLPFRTQYFLNIRTAKLTCLDPYPSIYKLSDSGEKGVIPIYIDFEPILKITMFHAKLDMYAHNVDFEV